MRGGARLQLGARGFGSIRAGEGKLVALCTLLAFSVLGSNVLVLASVTALFLGARSRTELPLAYTAAALFGVLSSSVAMSLSGRVTRAREASAVFAMLAAALVLAWLLIPVLDASFLFVVYPVCSGLMALAVVQAFAIVADCFDAEQAKRLLPMIGAGGTVGAVLSGGLMAVSAARLGTRPLLLLAALMIGLVAFASRGLMRTHVSEQAVSVRPRARSVRPQAPFARWTHDARELLVREPLVKWFALSQLCLWMASTLLKYELESALQHELTMDRIAVFLGLFNLGTNAAVLLVQALLEGRLLKRLGIGVGLTSTPVVLLLGLPLLLVSHTLAAVAATRLLEQVSRFSIARTAEDLLLLPLSSIKRRKAKTLLSATLAPCAVLLASSSIALLQRVSPTSLVLSGWSCAALALLCAFRLKKPYLERLRSTLAKPRLTLDPMGAPALDGGRAGVDIALSDALTGFDVRRVLFALTLIAETRAKVPQARIETLYQHADPRVRRAAFEASAAVGSAGFVALLLRSFAEEEDLEARRACARALCALVPDDQVELLAPVLNDKSPPVRAEALARRYSARARDESRKLSELAEGSAADREGLAHALARVAPSEHGVLLGKLLRDPAPEVRRAALFATGRTKDPAHLPALVEALSDRSLVRQASDALRAYPAELSVPELAGGARALQPTGARRRCVQLLGRIEHPVAAAALVTLLGAPSTDTEVGLLRALARQRARGRELGIDRAAVVAVCLAEAQRGRAIDRASAQLARELVRKERLRCVRAELSYQAHVVRERLFTWLLLIYPSDDIQRAQLTLEGHDRRARAFALEMLEHRLEPALRRAVLPQLSSHEPVERARSADAALGPLPAGSMQSILEQLGPVGRRLSDYLQLRLLSESRPDKDEEIPMSLLETMFVLRCVELFSQLSSDELRAVAAIAETSRVPKGQVVFREGDPGDAFYVVMRGELEVTRKGTRVAVLRDGECFGELALLDTGVRSGTVTVTAESELARIGSAEFHDLLEEAPSIARAMLRILARRSTTLLDRPEPKPP